MNLTKNTTSVTCPHCNHTTTYELTLHNLTEGRKLVCEKCGREIAVDRAVFENVEKVLERLGVNDTPGETDVTRSSVALQCPHCNKTSAITMSLQELGEKEKIFCQNCGKEIPIDRAKIQKAQNVLAGLRIPSGDGTETIDTPEGAVVVKTKTFNVDLKTNVDLGETVRRALGETTRGDPTPTGPRGIEPRKGCFGVMAVVVFVGTAILIYGFLG
jgi:transcription elongation factor Elf1